MKTLAQKIQLGFILLLIVMFFLLGFKNFLLLLGIFVLLIAPWLIGALLYSRNSGRISQNRLNILGVAFVLIYFFVISTVFGLIEYSKGNGSLGEVFVTSGKITFGVGLLAFVLWKTHPFIFWVTVKLLGPILPVQKRVEFTNASQAFENFIEKFNSNPKMRH